jgi:hypothetical protein
MFSRSANKPPRYVVMATKRSLGIRFGECYYSDGRNLVLESTRATRKIIGPIREALASGFFKRCEPPLDYPLALHATDRQGKIAAARYVIPKADRGKVLQQLWPYVEKPPRLSAVRFDLIAGKLFKVGDFIVIRECESNLLLSPYGGTVIDWALASWGKPPH